MRKNKEEAGQNPVENVTEFPLDEVVRKGAQGMLEQALEIEVDSFLGRYQYILDDEGREEFLKKLEKVLKNDSEILRQKGISKVENESWRETVDKASNCLNEVHRQKRPPESFKGN